MKEQEITVEVSLPQIRSALKIDGNGASQIMLEAPETELPNVLKLMLMKGKTFKIKVIGNGKEKTNTKTTGRRKTTLIQNPRGITG